MIIIFYFPGGNTPLPFHESVYLIYGCKRNVSHQVAIFFLEKNVLGEILHSKPDGLT